MPSKKEKLALSTLTLPGLKVAEKIARELHIDINVPKRLSEKTKLKTVVFDSLYSFMEQNFHKFTGHIVIAATGLVVREIAPFLKDKKTDPAVVSLGQDGRYVISLLSGHLGGGNELAKRVASITQGTPIINTATDIAKVPAMEMLARDLGLHITDFQKLPAVSRELSEGSKVPLYDPEGFLTDALKPWKELFPELAEDIAFSKKAPEVPSIYVDYQLRDFPDNAMVMVPQALSLGLGCHRGIEFQAVKDFVSQIFAQNKLSLLAVAKVATVELRKNEPALIQLAKELER
ncbi:MAG: cobalamin biosynthesis protein, partial [Deltaproteobacteria bacterium]|nr:cobalamin biosynthesis protein [Deltaproteobacteria bacterium]